MRCERYLLSCSSDLLNTMFDILDINLMSSSAGKVHTSCSGWGWGWGLNPLCLNAEKTSDRRQTNVQQTSSQRRQRRWTDVFWICFRRWTRWRRRVILQRSMQISSSSSSSGLDSERQSGCSCLIKASEANETQLFVQCLHCPARLSLSVYQMRLAGERHWWTRDFTLQRRQTQPVAYEHLRSCQPDFTDR